MKKVLALAFVLLVCLALTASAAEDNWRFYVRGESPGGANFGVNCQLGAYTTPSLMPYDYVDYTGTTVCVALQEGNSTYKNVIQSPTDWPHWTIRMAAAYKDVDHYPYDTMVLSFTTASPITALPPSWYGFRLEMINNQGVPGAPANGTVWYVPTPTKPDTNFFRLTVPTISLHALANEPDMLADSYVFALYGPIPEPSSLLALGAGVVGLLGYAVRRRRA